MDVQDPGSVGIDGPRLARVDEHLRRYVDDGRLAGYQVRVTRRACTVLASTYGLADVEAGVAVADDTLWRIYSMTKPVTAVAAMALYERGLFRLNDELSQHLPEFADMRILVGGNVDEPKTVPALEPIRIWHLFTHTAGLTYAFTRSSLLDDLYRVSGADPVADPSVDLAQMCQRWAALPLMFEPGTSWNYSVATDVLGRLIEVLTGQSLDQSFRELVLGPLGMDQTRWWVDEEAAPRLAALYVPNPGGGALLRHDALGARFLQPPALFGGGGGLVSTAADYARFTQLLVRGGEVDGVRVLGPRTFALMTRNHLPGERRWPAWPVAPSRRSAMQVPVSVWVWPSSSILPPHASPGTPASCTWGGLASTAFWVDPAEDLTVEFYTQLVPSSTYPIRTELRQIVHAALID